MESPTPKTETHLYETDARPLMLNVPPGYIEFPMGGRWPKEWKISWYLYRGIGDAKYRVYVINKVGDTEEKPREVVGVGSWFEVR